MKDNLVAGLPEDNSQEAIRTVEAGESSIVVIEEFLDVQDAVEQIIPVSVTLGCVKALGVWKREKLCSKWPALRLQANPAVGRQDRDMLTL